MEFYILAKNGVMDEYSVLVIDDDVWMQRILSKVLEGFGFTPYIANNGFDGVALALEHHPMMIFLDIMMPELSGHLTLKMLKCIKQTKEIPVLMISALSDTENLGIAVKTGAVGFISKPFTRSTIFDKLRNVIGGEMLNEIAKKSQMSEQRTSGELETSSATDTETAESLSPFTDDPRGERDRTTDHPMSTPSEATKRYQEESNKQQLDAIKELLLKDEKK